MEEIPKHEILTPATPEGMQIHRDWLHLLRTFEGLWEFVADRYDEYLSLSDSLRSSTFGAKLRPMEVSFRRSDDPNHGTARPWRNLVTSHLTNEPCLAAHLVFRSDDGIYLRSLRAAPFLLAGAGGGLSLVRGPIFLEPEGPPSHRRPGQETPAILAALGLHCTYEVPAAAEEHLMRAGDRVVVTGFATVEDPAGEVITGPGHGEISIIYHGEPRSCGGSMLVFVGRDDD